MPRQRQAMELPSIGPLDREKGGLGRQLAQALRNAIREGTLKPGETLPSSRHLAATLELGRGTVLEVFEQLTAEGYLEASPRGSTKVANALVTPSAVVPREAIRPDTLKQLRGAAEVYASISEQFAALPPIPFAISVPVGAASPGDAWKRIGNRVRSSAAGGPSSYDDPQGALVLRKAIAEYVRRSRSVRCTADQVVVTSGTQQGLFLSCNVLLDAQSKVWLEDPAYRGISGILETSRRPETVIRVPVDDSGIDVQAGRILAEDATAAFVTPSHQYPLGMPMSMGRRNELVTWALEKSAWIVEDDYDSELRYAGHPFPSLQGICPERVIYLGTFSKILFPSLRLGYAVVPPALVPAFTGARVLMDRHSPSSEQHVLAEFIDAGHLDKHIRRVRNLYGEQRQTLIALIEKAIPRELAWLQPSQQGMHMVLWLREGTDDMAVVTRGLALGVALRAISPMYSTQKRRPGLLLGLGGFTQNEMELAVQRLACAIRSVM